MSDLTLQVKPGLLCTSLAKLILESSDVNLRACGQTKCSNQRCFLIYFHCHPSIFQSVFVFEVAAAAPRESLLPLFAALMLEEPEAAEVEWVLVRFRSALNSALALIKAAVVGDTGYSGNFYLTLHMTQEPLIVVSHLSMHPLWKRCRQRKVRTFSPLSRFI